MGSLFPPPKGENSRSNPIPAPHIAGIIRAVTVTINIEQSYYSWFHKSQKGIAGCWPLCVL